MLAQHFLTKYSIKNQKQVKGFSPLAMDMLLKYAWPGNIRELENTIERAVILLLEEHITEKELPSNITEAYADKCNWFELSSSFATNRPLDEIEKEVILAMYLRQTEVIKK